MQWKCTAVKFSHIYWLTDLSGEIACDNTSTTVRDTNHFHSDPVDFLDNCHTCPQTPRGGVGIQAAPTRFLRIFCDSLMKGPSRRARRVRLCSLMNHLRSRNPDATTTPSFVLVHLEHLIPSVSPPRAVPPVIRNLIKPRPFAFFIANKHPAIDARLRKHNTVFFLLFYAQGNNEAA